MPDYKKPKAVHLSSDDQVRMIRLHEELLSRAGEMGRIIGRNLNISSTFPIGEVRLADSNSSAGPQMVAVARYENGRLVAVGCWDEKTKTCHQAPCE